MFDFSGESGGGDVPYDQGGMLSTELFEVLTDALRSGPGTACWIRAVQYLNATPGSEQYKSLLTARQRLESGKLYRALEGSPQLANAVMARVAAEAGVPMPVRGGMSGPLTTRMVALVGGLAAIMVLAIAGMIVAFMMGDGAGRQIIRLPVQPTQVNSRMFESVLPVGWQTIGSLRVKADRGLRLAGGLKGVDQSGGVVWDQPLPNSRPFKVEAKVRYMGSASVSPEIFLTDDQTLDDDRPANRNHEFVWTVLNDRPGVKQADQTLAYSGEQIRSGVAATLLVEIKIDGATAVVGTDVGGVHTRWSGAHLLDTGKPWKMGVRFVVHGTHHEDCVSVDSLCFH